MGYNSTLESKIVLTSSPDALYETYQHSRIDQLQQEITKIQATVQCLLTENEALRATVQRLLTENEALRKLDDDNFKAANDKVDVT